VLGRLWNRIKDAFLGLHPETTCPIIGLHRKLLDSESLNAALLGFRFYLSRCNIAVPGKRISR
jgi:hypothetical protein